MKLKIGHGNGCFSDRIRREMKMGVLLMVGGIAKHRGDVYDSFSELFSTKGMRAMVKKTRPTTLTCH